MAIEGFSPPSPSPYYKLLERGSARLGHVKENWYGWMAKKRKYHWPAHSIIVIIKLIVFCLLSSNMNYNILWLQPPPQVISWTTKNYFYVETPKMECNVIEIATIQHPFKSDEAFNTFIRSHYIKTNITNLWKKSNQLDL